jgi:hypothetical protein
MKFMMGVVLLLPALGWSADSVTPLDVKLGLWESTSTSQTTGMPPMPDSVLQKLTPEQRARMEAAAKAREAKGPRQHTQQSCVTKDSLAKAMTFGQSESNQQCTRTVLRSSSHAQDLSYTCEGMMKGTGEIHIEASDNEHVKGSSSITTSGGGNAMNVKMSFEAHWIGSDCSAIKK